MKYPLFIICFFFASSAMANLIRCGTDFCDDLIPNHALDSALACTLTEHGYKCPQIAENDPHDTGVIGITISQKPELSSCNPNIDTFIAQYEANVGHPLYKQAVCDYNVTMLGGHGGVPKGASIQLIGCDQKITINCDIEEIPTD